MRALTLCEISRAVPIMIDLRVEDDLLKLEARGPGLKNIR